VTLSSATIPTSATGAKSPPRLASLGLAWLLLALALTLPILLVAALEIRRIDRTVAQITREIRATQWIAQAVDIVDALDALRFVPAAVTRDNPCGLAPREPRAVASLDARFARLARFTAANSAVLPNDVPAFKIVDEARRAYLARPCGETASRFVAATYHAVSSISDGAQLSFESDVATASLADAVDNTFLQVHGPLGAAAQTFLAGSRRGRLTMMDRITIAKLLGQAQSSVLNFGGDVTLVAAGYPALSSSIASAAAEALRASDALSSELQRQVGLNVPLGGPEPRATIEASAARLARATSALEPRLVAGTFSAMDVQMRELVVTRRKTVLIAVGTIAFVFGTTLYVGLLVNRRDRRELNRAQQKARALAAELAQKRAEHDRMLTEAQFDAVFDRSQIGIAFLDRTGATTECNPALATILGSSRPQLLDAGDRRFGELLEGLRETFQFEEALPRADGTTCHAQITVSAVGVPRSDDVAAIAMVQDISERIAIDERLRYESSHDHLTSLLNRPQFLTQLEALLSSRPERDRFAVLFIDLDKFKLVNDTLGHPAGDKAITIAAQRLSGATRPGDVVARLHGDEFAVLLHDGASADPGRAVADRINTAFNAPITLDGTAVVLTASIGIVAGLQGYDSAEDVMRDADVAMYAAKNAGRSTSAVFKSEMHDGIGGNMRLMADMRFAIERGEFRMVYQPIVNLVTGTIVGVESLMRWRHPTLGEIPPIDFIPIAEESDAILQLGRFALIEACALVARFDSKINPRLTCSVNVAIAQLTNGHVVRDVSDALELSGLAPERLMLEITESGLLENGTRASAVLAELDALGVRLCIDDFGTGYSSLRYLHEYPIDVLKIDRSFVYGEDGRVANEPIVQMLLTLARSLNIVAIAEGIETETQRTTLLESGCRSAQGYLFSGPLDEPSLLAWIQDRAASIDRLRTIDVA